ncbi:MAG: adenylate/guanylate cyclase domain-containing protein [Chloroflexi bacterium]|nr:adenylate/guanylate cyclase domain-containing protein [Chloroflexota bacterium]
MRDWRGYPLYIITTYLRGQLTLTLPSFLAAMTFTRIIARVVRYDLADMVTFVVCFVTAMAYIFYHYYSPNIRAFLASLIAGNPPSQELATLTWIETVNFPHLVVGWTMMVAVLSYAAQAVSFFLTIEFSQALELQGWIVALALTVAIALIFFLLYLERAMRPVALLALAMGAQANLDDPRVHRFRLRFKLLVLILPIMIVPLVTLGLFGYSQAVILGGDPTTSLLLTGTVVLLSGGVAVVLTLLLVRSVLTPVQELEQVMTTVAVGDLMARARPCTSDELADLGLHFNAMTKELAEQEQLKTAFGRYVSAAVRDGILSGQISLGGERRELTIAFTDIRDFTSWCERTSPEEVIQTLNAYYDNLVQILTEHGGTIARYTGDGVLVLFGAPLDDPDHARHAVEAALEARELLEKFNDIRRTIGAFELRTGFGIHTGVAVVGSIGCEARAEYTPIGDPANVASRIEGLNRELGTSILISQATYERVADSVIVGKTAETLVKGRVEPVQVYQVLGLRA